MNRSELSDLIASAPASLREKLDRASDAYDAGDFGLAADLVGELSQGHTTWHERAAELADDIEMQAFLPDWADGVPQ